MVKLGEFANIVEALIFASECPLREEKLIEAHGAWASENGDDNRSSQEAVASAILELNHRYSECEGSFRIRKVGGGYQMYTLPEFHRWVSEFLLQRGPTKLSPAALETLSIIAYRQPAVKSEIDNIRGVDSEGPLHSLLERGLIKTSGRKEAPGRPYIFRTTPDFLLHFDLNDLSELPPEEELMAVLKASGDSLGPAEQQGEFFEGAISADSAGVTLEGREEVESVGSEERESEDAIGETPRQEEIDNDRQNSSGR